MKLRPTILPDLDHYFRILLFLKFVKNPKHMLNSNIALKKLKSKYKSAVSFSSSIMVPVSSLSPPAPRIRAGHEEKL